MRFTIFAPCTGTISVNSAFVRTEVRRRKWLLPPFVRTTMPDPVMRNRLDVALWVFSLYFPAFCLRGTCEPPLYKALRPAYTAALQTCPVVLDNFQVSILEKLFLFGRIRPQHHRHHAPFHIGHLFHRADV